MHPPDDEPGPSSLDPTGLNTATTGVSVAAGDRIGRYKILQRIGEGGFGVVYVADQEQPVRRRVALKVVKLGMDTKAVIARFDAERQALALMDHPNIATVFDAGATETGRPFFVMELVHGIRITDYCDQHNLPTHQRLGLFIQVCHAIQHAHQKGVIHRDIKPSNILVTLHDGAPVPKVIDFGIAKATTAQRLTDQTIYTALEQFIGTPAYVSPEQAEMSGLDIDTRSDIYSLGVLLYELLTGRTPFDAARLRDAGLEEMRRIIREQEPSRPSTRLSTLTAADLTTVARRRRTEPPRLVSALRGDLDWIVMKALEKDRTRRYESASALAEDIQRHLRHEPVIAAAPSASYRFRKFGQRNKAALATAASIAVVLVAAAVISAWLAVRATRAERAASTEAAKSRQVAQFLKQMLMGVGPSVALGRDTTLLREILDRTAERVSQDLKDQPAVDAELRNTLGEVYYELGDLAKAEPLYREALAIRTTLYGHEHLEVAESLGNLALVLEDHDKLADAEAMMGEALRIVRAVSGNDNEQVAANLSNLSLLFRQQARLADAEALQRDALAMRVRHLGANSTDVASSLNSLALILQEQGKLDEAATLQRQALDIQRARLGETHPSLLVSLNNLALLLQRRNDFAGAESIHREVLAKRRALLGNDHLLVAASLNNLGTVLQSDGRFGEAEAFHREALALRRKLLGAENVGVADSLTNLGALLADRGNLADAEVALREASAIYRRRLGGEHQALGNALNGLARVLYGERQFAEAEIQARASAAIRDKTTPDHWSRFDTHSLIGLTLVGQRQYAAAEPLLLSGYEGMKQRERTLPANRRSRLREALQGLVDLYDATSQRDKAAEWKKTLEAFDAAAS